jgi:hypothetical protein
MYKYLMVLFLLALFVIGCTDESNMVGPVNDSANKNEMVVNPNVDNLPADNQSLNNNITTSPLIITLDSTKVPSGLIHPDSRWGFIN